MSTSASTATLPRENYLNAGYGVKSWLLTTDHKRIALLYLAAITVFFFIGGAFATSDVLADLPARWSTEKAAKWEKKHGWLVGCNFAPAYAINELEMWQADTFDLKEINRELDLAQSIGFNSVRVFLHDLLWEQDSKGFLHRMDQFLAAADHHRIGFCRCTGRGARETR